MFIQEENFSYPIHRMYEYMGMPSDFLSPLSWQDVPLGRRGSQYGQLPLKMRSKITDLSEHFLLRSHKKLVAKYEGMFYVPQCVLEPLILGDDLIVSKVEQSMMVRLEREIKRAEKRREEEMTETKREVLVRNRRKYHSFPSQLDPPDPKQAFQEELELQGKHFKPRTISRKWKNLTEAERNQYIEPLRTLIEEHEEATAISVRKALADKDWFALRRREVVNFGTTQDIDMYDKAWAERSLPSTVTNSNMNRGEGNWNNFI